MSVIVFCIYIFLLIWLILFSTNWGDLDHIRNINLIPFKGSMIVNVIGMLIEVFALAMLILLLVANA